MLFHELCNIFSNIFHEFSIIYIEYNIVLYMRCEVAVKSAWAMICIRNFAVININSLDWIYHEWIILYKHASVIGASTSALCERTLFSDTSRHITWSELFRFTYTYCVLKSLNFTYSTGQRVHSISTQWATLNPYIYKCSPTIFQITPLNFFLR